jgi:hypothetical protein
VVLTVEGAVPEAAAEGGGGAVAVPLFSITTYSASTAYRASTHTQKKG